MSTYLVGGAVRDTLLGLPVNERDWVVVGSTSEAMLAQGFKQVGKDFPVFLHPSTQEEYALARIERKVGVGYTGFECDAGAGVSLEEDLLRRDLTINAIAQTFDAATGKLGELVDPYGGGADIEAKVLRHVSEAFLEDPLRVLRLARFAARFAHLGFTVAEETLVLMRGMAASGELASLVAERVWRELERSLATNSPQQFIVTLRSSHALKEVLPEVDALFGVPQTEKYHPEVDTGKHVLLVLEQAAHMQLSTIERYAALLHDLGKGTTPQDKWPRHIEHEQRSVALVKTVNKRLRAPKAYADVALKVAEYHTHCHRALELKPSTIMKLFIALDVFRRPEMLELFVNTCEADARGRKGLQENPYPQSDYLRDAYLHCATVDVTALRAQGFDGAELGERIKQQRGQQLAAWVKESAKKREAG